MKKLIYLVIILIFFSCKNENDDLLTKNHSIERIELKSFNIRGEWKIILDNSLNAFFENKKHLSNTNYIRKKIAQENYDKIANLLYDIDFPNLKDSISSNFSCGRICRLKITYDNGRIKQLYDYGREENPKLTNIYKEIEALNETDIYIHNEK